MLRKVTSTRELLIGQYDTLLRNHRDWMATPEAEIVYQRRKELSESTFGIMKEQMGFRHFLLRGLEKIKAEIVMLATAFNLRNLYRAWHQRLNKTWKTRPAEAHTFVSVLYLVFMGYSEVKMLDNMVVTY